MNHQSNIMAGVPLKNNVFLIVKPSLRNGARGERVTFTTNRAPQQDVVNWELAV